MRRSWVKTFGFVWNFLWGTVEVNLFRVWFSWVRHHSRPGICFVKKYETFSNQILEFSKIWPKFVYKTMEENLEIYSYYWSRLGLIGVELPSEPCCARILSQNLLICVKSLVGVCWSKSVQSVIYLGETPCQAWDLQQVPCGVLQCAVARRFWSLWTVLTNLYHFTTINCEVAI